MTRKDYVKFAALIAAQPRTPQLATIMANIADIFAADNPNFDRTRFYAACAGA